MSFIEVYFNSSLQNTIEISGETVSVGRADHNQIQIDNKGVSLLHAVISKKGNNWFIEDLNSTNGTYLNDVKIAEKQLIKLGDTIGIGKHNLKLVNTRSQVAPARAVPQFEDADRTIMLNHNRSEPSVKKPRLHHCQLLVHGEIRNINKLLLNRDSYTIGKGKVNDLRVGGWFTPNIIAEISRLGDSYYLTPLANRQVKINGRVIYSRVKLINDDNITTKKMTLKFVSE